MLIDTKCVSIQKNNNKTKKNMPLSAAAMGLAGAGMQAGGGLLGNIIGAISTGRQNKKNREFAEHMYDRQREDALADWDMQNEYNSPKAQMQRLQDANLNPDLIYGGGGFTQAAGVPRSSSAPSVDFKSFRPDMSFIGDSLNTYYNIKQSNAQTDNLVANNSVITMDVLLKAAQVLNTNASTANITGDTAQKKFNLQQAEQLSPYVIELAKKQVDKVQADIDYTLTSAEMSKAVGYSTIAKAAEEILNYRMSRAVSKMDIDRIRQQIEILKSDSGIRKLDLEAYKQGIRPTDSLGARLIGRLVGPNFIDNIKKNVEDFSTIPRKINQSLHASPEQKRIRDSIFKQYEKDFRR